MLGLKTRIDHINRSLNGGSGSGNGRFIIVQSCGGPMPATGHPGEITRYSRAVMMFVDERYAKAPLAGLSDRQRRFLRTGDRLCISSEWIEEGPEGQEVMLSAERWARWPESNEDEAY